MKSEINISSGHHDEFVTTFRIGNDSYQCSTENIVRKCNVITRIYLKGEILATVTSHYAHMAKLPDLHEKVNEIMERQHRSAMETFMARRSTPEKTTAHYAEEIRECVNGGDLKAALGVARRALDRFPSDPFFHSYCGYLMSVVERRPKEGSVMCEEAINMLKRSKSTDFFFFLPLFYLHLGRAYLSGDRKEAAIKAFLQGLKYDRSDGDLLSEVRGLGIRRRPVFPFLERNHPINKYLGKMRHRLQAAG